MRKALPLFATMLLVAFAVQAQSSPSFDNPTLTPPETEELKLFPTRAGLELDADGVVAITTFGDGSAIVAVRANVSLPDGSVLVVSVIDQSGEVADIGAIEVRLGSGLLRLSSNNAPESAAFPTDEIALFQVSHRGEVLLERAR